MLRKTIVIDGDLIDDVPSFYAEINRVFMADESWQLGHSLDALNDLLHGGYGAAQGDGPIDLMWLNMEKNRHDLGFDVTKAFYENKLKSPHIHSVEMASRNLEELMNGTGQTYFDIVIEIIESHERIDLRGITARTHD